MTPELHTISDLISKYQQGSLTDAESLELEAWVDRSSMRRELFSDINSGEVAINDLELFYYFKGKRGMMSERISAQIPAFGKAVNSEVHRVHFLQTAWFRYAAILLLLAGTATFLYLNNEPHKEITQTANTGKAADILPGGNKAILTLADGSTIVLDSAATGILAQQGNAKVTKIDAGLLAYNTGTDQTGKNGEVLYNTISTPKGGQYQIVLPDGSKVWLNAASSVRFPTVFDKARIIAVTGEVYVEAAADKNKPFRVQVKDATIDVLGTEFNVNAYEEERAVQTTLIAGSVKVMNAGNSLLLQPGQQAYLGGDGLRRVSPDLEQVTAWKKGLFNANNLSVEQLMWQLCKWYDPKGIPAIRLEGEIKRNLNFNEMLHFLRILGVHCELKPGRQLIITP
jgi:ferric-dicitrate binding protein FerR (iron transport regulator)